MSDETIPEAFRNLARAPGLERVWGEEEMGARLVAESLHWSAEQHLLRVRELYEQAELLEEQAATEADEQTRAGLAVASSVAFWSTTLHKQAARLLRERGLLSLGDAGPLEAVERLLVERTQAHRQQHPSL